MIRVLFWTVRGDYVARAARLGWVKPVLTGCSAVAIAVIVAFKRNCSEVLHVGGV